MASPNEPSSRTSVAIVAARLQSDGTIVNSFHNSEPAIKRIEIVPNRLIEMFDNILRPIVYGNYRGLGVRTVTNQADTQYLDSAIFTVAVNAVQACYAVGYTKTQKVNYGSVFQYGGRPEVDKFKLPAMVALLCNSFGPITRARESYRCTFIPILVKNDVDALRADPRYDSRKEEMFRLAMQRAHYSITMSDVDIANEISSCWWMLHVAQTTEAGAVQPTHQAVYSPVSHADLDTASTLASVVLSSTLYDFPGPIHTSKIGPFVARDHADSIADIPAPLRDDLALNVSPPVRLFRFVPDRTATQADVIAFGAIQGDAALTARADPGLRDPNRLIGQIDRTFRDHIQDLHDYYTTDESTTDTAQTAVTVTGTDPSPQKKPPAKRHRTPSERPEPLHTQPVFAEPGNQVLGLSIYTVEVYYFDHVQLDNFPISRREGIVTEANSTN